MRRGAVDVVLGFDTRRRATRRAAAHVGGVVGRYANRIAGARFALDGVEHALAANEGRHQLHGGARGFDRRLWRRGGCRAARPASPSSSRARTATRASPVASVPRVATGSSGERELALRSRRRRDRATPVSLTQHAYWHLGGSAGRARPSATFSSSRRTATSRSTPSTSRPARCATSRARPSTSARRAARSTRAATSHDPELAAFGGYDHPFALRGGRGRAPPGRARRPPAERARARARDDGALPPALRRAVPRGGRGEARLAPRAGRGLLPRAAALPRRAEPARSFRRRSCAGRDPPPGDAVPSRRPAHERSDPGAPRAPDRSPSPASAARRSPSPADAARMSWASYARRSDRLAQALLGLGPRARRARRRAGCPTARASTPPIVGCEKAGLVVVGIGPRAGLRELRHLLRRLGRARAREPRRAPRRRPRGVRRGARAEGAPLAHHVRRRGRARGGRAAPRRRRARRRAAGRSRRRSARSPPDELFLLNSTSGTTGLPKCVTHDQARWFAFHALAVEAGALSRGGRLLLGAAGALRLRALDRPRDADAARRADRAAPRFDAPRRCSRDRAPPRDGARRGEHAVRDDARVAGARATPTSPRCACSSPAARRCRAARAARFEERDRRARAPVLRLERDGRALAHDPRATRRRCASQTAGHVIPRCRCGSSTTTAATSRRAAAASPAAAGPRRAAATGTTPRRTASSTPPDGWMLTGDVAELDADGVLRVVGRTADFIIRGGKNVSAAEVEAEVATHPAVALAAAVAMPDPIFGERVCVYVELRPGDALTLDELGRAPRGARARQARACPSASSCWPSCRAPRAARSRRGRCARTSAGARSREE